jgi:hypothetical protein
MFGQVLEDGKFEIHTGIRFDLLSTERFITQANFENKACTIKHTFFITV